MSAISISAIGARAIGPATPSAVDHAYAVAAKALHVAHHTQTTDLADGASEETHIANVAAVQAAELSLNSAAAEVAQHHRQARADGQVARPSHAGAGEPAHLDPGTTVDVYL